MEVILQFRTIVLREYSVVRVIAQRTLHPIRVGQEAFTIAESHSALVHDDTSSRGES